MRSLTVARAYQQAARHRNIRDQEADVFRRVNATLRGAQAEGGLALAKALADNGRLWITVIDLMRDPTNSLPLSLRAATISVGLAVQREANAAEPDMSFLIGINEQIAAGMSGL